MKVIVNGETYQLDAKDDLTNVEVMAIEKAIGVPAGQWVNGSMNVVTGMVWITMRRENPNIKFADVVFKLADVTPDEDDETDEGKGEDS